MNKQTTVSAGVIELELMELERMDLQREEVILSFTNRYTEVFTLVCC